MTARFRSGLVSLLLVLVLAGLVDAAYRHRSGPHSVQSLRNLTFVVQAEHGGLGRALSAHTPLRPPLYALVLYGLARLGVPVHRVNELLLGLLLLLLYLEARRSLGGLHPLVPVGLFALLHFNYVNAYQCTAEALFAPLALALLLALRPPVHPAAAALTASALAATRYFALFSFVPLGGLHVLLARGESWRRRVGRAGAYGAVGLLPVLAWMARAWRQTGYLTGADRFGARALPAALAHWQSLHGLVPTSSLWAKTLFIDFFSLGSYAALSVVTYPYRPLPAEWLTGGLALGALVVSVVVLRRELLDPRTPVSLAAQFFLAYNLGLILVWTYANNDPLYSRFLYPGYVFLVLVGLHGFAALEAGSAPRWQRWLFQGLALALALTHLTRHLAGPVLPYR